MTSRAATGVGESAALLDLEPSLAGVAVVIRAALLAEVLDQLQAAQAMREEDPTPR